MSTLIVVRHGQSVYNLENRFTGNLDIELTTLGREEARKSGLKLKGYHFDVAFTSKLKRACESLTIILKVIKQSEIPIYQSSALNERMYGSLQGLNKAETAAKYGIEQVEVWRRSYDICPPEGESLAATFERAVPYYKTEIEPLLRANKNILIVAHGNSLRALMMYLEDLSPAAIAEINIPTGFPKIYVLDDDLKIIETKYL